MSKKIILFQSVIGRGGEKLYIESGSYFFLKFAAGLFPGAQKLDLVSSSEDMKY